MNPFRFSLLLVLLLPTFVGAQQTQPNSKCLCPHFRVVSELEMVKAGDTVEFEIASADPSALRQEYEWTVSAGAIISGQGTRKITVQTTEEMLVPKPLASPTPLAPGVQGVFMGGHRRGLLKLTVSAAPADTDCACRAVSTEVQIGRMNRERNKPAEATDLRLSMESLILPCAPGRLPREGVIVSPSMVIDVGVTAHDPENDILTYNYTVSGGKIVGTGANVKWDLSDVAPGAYTITAGADDGCGICGKTQTKTVTVADCQPTCTLCQCATVEIAGPTDDALRAGENVFTANVIPGTYDPTYEWMVDGGEIVSGQGTPSISVAFDQKSLKSNKLVRVRIGGAGPECSCITEGVVEYENARRKP